MKEKIKYFFGEILDWFSVVVAIVIYGIAGNLLMYPYTFLIGWDDNLPPLNAAFFGIIFLPAAMISLCVLYHIGKDRRQRLRRAELQDTAETAYRLFWWMLGLLLLPIMTNGLSLLLKEVGQRLSAALSTNGATRAFSLSRHRLFSDSIDIFDTSAISAATMGPEIARRSTMAPPHRRQPPRLMASAAKPFPPRSKIFWPARSNAPRPDSPADKLPPPRYRQIAGIFIFNIQFHPVRNY